MLILSFKVTFFSYELLTNKFKVETNMTEHEMLFL